MSPFYRFSFFSGCAKIDHMFENYNDRLETFYEQKKTLLPQKTKKTDSPGAPRTGCADPWYCRIWKWAG